mgnify:CR=1 FL=1
MEENPIKGVKKIRQTILIALILTTAFFMPKNVFAPTTIRVPHDYPTIQEAINAASNGDTITVAAGYYYGHVVINKTLTLVGEDPETTIIEYFENDTVYVRANNVNISGFTIKNRRVYYGIWVEPIPSSGITIKNNIITNSSVGVGIQYSTNTLVTENVITKNEYGIRIYQSTSNTFTMNTISNNIFEGLHILQSSNNLIHRNNFINNPQQASQDETSTNYWDNGAEGNYWSDYAGQDLNGDGIGDTLIPHQGLDNKPLMTPWNNNKVFQVQIMEMTYQVRVNSNTSTTNLVYNGKAKHLNLTVTGMLYRTGFCNITIPKQLLYGEPWQITVDDSLLSYTITQNITHSILYIRYHYYSQTTLTITITGTRACVIPGDYNADGIVNIADANMVGTAWQYTFENPNYKWQADANVDGVINIADVTTLGLHWQQKEN